MKRDLELVKKILLEAEKSEHGGMRKITLEGYFDETVRYHIFLMMEANLVHGVETNLMQESPGAVMDRITWDGYEFLDNARNDTIWKKARTACKGLGFEALKTVLQELAKTLVLSQVSNE